LPVKQQLGMVDGLRRNSACSTPISLNIRPSRRCLERISRQRAKPPDRDRDIKVQAFIKV